MLHYRAYIEQARAYQCVVPYGIPLWHQKVLLPHLAGIDQVKNEPTMGLHSGSRRYVATFGMYYQVKKAPTRV